jgi:hypothetical protein
MSQITPIAITPILVGAEKCLEILFPDEELRPSIRSFKEW